MKIVNIMLSRRLGGIEQSFLDYSNALKMQNFKVINITSILAKTNTKFDHTHTLSNLCTYDIFSIIYLWFLIKRTKPDIIICHGRRAIEFAHLANINAVLIGVAHNYSIKSLKKCDYVIALTQHMKEHLIQNKCSTSKIHVIPNMLNTGNETNSTYNLKTNSKLNNTHESNAIVIGVISRFVKKKGVDIFLKALAILKTKQYKFTAIIAGDGEEKDNLIRLSKKLGIEQQVEFIGWVDDKAKFYNSIEIFCLPSVHEPFGIVLLEAMFHKVPIISSNTEGPNEILRPNQDGIFYENGSVEDLAKAIVSVIDNKQNAMYYTKSAYDRLIENYTMNAVSAKLSTFLHSIKPSTQM